VIEDVNFVPSLGIDLSRMTKTASGLYYEDVVEGTGDPAAAQDTVDVSYTGYLTNGAVFDSGSYSFVLATGKAIPGFDEGVTGMKVGGQRRIIIPPALAYGAASIGSIPAGSILIFDLELIELD
jgi:peptidylprolyl isomerase